TTLFRSIWKFDMNLKDTVYPTTHNEVIATPVIIGNYMYIANGQDPAHGEGRGDLWCVATTKTGVASLEISATPNPPNIEPGQELIAPPAAIPSRKGIPNSNSAVI